MPNPGGNGHWLSSAQNYANILCVKQFSVPCSVLKSVGKLEHQKVCRQRIRPATMKELVIALEQQRIGEVINIADGVTISAGALPVAFLVKSRHQLNVVEDRQIQIQTRQLITSLCPNRPRMHGSEVAGAIPGIDEFALEFKV